ncbi:acyl-CoA synthetase [Streptomyces sedi]|uniref:Long-chain fatty acid--CoA ligase n=1 Tax=Streptomyces sedi TaxID=555059 RepID=A0A5C4UQK3_9ACTN|nr:long-chain fatty acid--CoA ligase [Streptomyces sedi]TNM25914.1 long-chain fatty acid--CoA ligase [Streptomyces sedi]
MRDHGLGSWPARCARRAPHHTALVHRGRHTSFAELRERTTRLARALRTRGVRPGDRVAYLGPNDPAFLETLFGVAALGAVFVPLNARQAPPETAFQLADCGAKALLYAPSHAELVRAAAPRGRGPRWRVRIGPDYEAMLAEAAADPVDEPVSPDQPCLIMYTSGSTGTPKGAVLTHANVTWNALNVLVDLDLTAGERALAVAPLFHAAALNMLALPVLLKGGTCVLLERFDAAEVLDVVAARRITFLFGVPTMFELLARADEWPGADLSSLRSLLCGGAPIPAELVAAYAERGLAVRQGYGMTEAAPGVLLTGRDPGTGGAPGGVPHFFTDVRIVRPDRRPGEPGDIGELQVSGPNVMAGYWGAAGRSAACFDGEWFRSGDAARGDARGRVRVVDRLGDVIVSGGENVYPAEVERVLLGHPEIADCVVTGVPDPLWGEVPRAVVVPRDGASPTLAGISAYLSGRLARYKSPRSVVLVAELPRTPSGKVRRSAVRERHGGP